MLAGIAAFLQVIKDLSPGDNIDHIVRLLVELAHGFDKQTVSLLLQFIDPDQALVKRL